MSEMFAEKRLDGEGLGVDGWKDIKRGKGEGLEKERLGGEPVNVEDG